MNEDKTQQKHPFFSKRNILIILGTIVATILLYYVQSGVYFKASIFETANIPPFNGTVMPVGKTLNWTKLTHQDFTDFKAGNLTYENAGNKLMDIMPYDKDTLCTTDPAQLGWSENDLTIRNMFLTYVTTYLGKYTSGSAKTCERDGSHPAVDIRSPKLTPVFVVANGMITKLQAGGTSGNGNVICIGHPNVPSMDNPLEKTTYYSCYLHLDSIAQGLAVGSIVTKGQEIGKIGDTGLATTYHLHFQLDKDSAPYHPYWPFTSSEAQTAGCNFFDCINQAIGLNTAEQYTINPMKWVQYNLTYNQTASAGTNDSGTSTQNKNTNTSQNNGNRNNNQNTQQNRNTNTSSSNRNNNDVQNANRNVSIDNNSSLGNTTGTFSDVSPTSPYYKAITKLSSLGIINGYPNGTFGPDKPINRAEITKILIRAFKIPDNTKVKNSFYDVSSSDWFSPYVNTVLAKGIINGYPDGSFRPARNTSRAEFAKMMLLAANIKDLSDVAIACTDVTTVNPPWYYNYADYFCRKKLLLLNNNIFEPGKEITRKEVAYAIAKQLELL